MTQQIGVTSSVAIQEVISAPSDVIINDVNLGGGFYIGGATLDRFVWLAGNDFFDGKYGQDALSLTSYQKSDVILSTSSQGLTRVFLNSVGEAITLANVESISFSDGDISLTSATFANGIYDSSGGGSVYSGISGIDQFVWMTGNDVYDGKEGQDVLNITFYKKADVILSTSSQGLTTVFFPSRGEAVTISNIEKISFSDGDINLTPATFANGIYDSSGGGSVYSGTAGMDQFVWMTGNDVYDGKEGQDVLNITFYREADAVLTSNLDGSKKITIPSRNEWITLRNIEVVSFTDGDLIVQSNIDVNQSPTDFSLASSGITENSPAGTVIGTLSATDPDAGSTFTYSLAAGNGTNDADNALVDIIGNQVKVKSGALIDYETNPTLNLYIRVTDNGGLSYTKAVTAPVLDVPEDNSAPTIRNIAIKDSTVILRFSEIISADQTPAAAFTVETQDALGNVALRDVSVVALDQNDKTQVVLVISGTAPTSDLNVRVSYADPTTANDQMGVIQDLAGNDLASFASDFADTFLAFSNAALASQYSSLTLLGSSDASGTGNALNNIINGNGGSNLLDGGSGADQMNGKAGSDTYVVDNAADVVIEDAATTNGIDVVQASVTYAINDADIENLTLTGTAAINGTGNAAVNTLTGNSAANVLDGGTGADAMVGGAGNDTYIVDDAADVVTEASSAGKDTVQSSVSYALGANIEALSLAGSAAINGTGNALNNTLTGNAAANTLNGGAGVDALIGGKGNDVYVVDNANDVVTESASEGKDTVRSSVTQTLAANVEDLTLTGALAINGTGNAAANTIVGNGASNVLVGAAGADVLTGGLGADTFRFALTDSLLSTMDRITDLAIGTDQLDGPTAVSAANLKELGAVTALTQAALSTLLTSTTFAASGAATFSYLDGGTRRTFLAFNDGTAGYSSTADAIHEITGFSGLLTSLAII